MNIELIFISNRMLNPEFRDNLKLPLHFVSFAVWKGHLYKNYIIKDTFMMRSRFSTEDVVYGALYILDDADFYIRTIDSFMLCSKSILRRNHEKDHNHRITEEVTPIAFDTIEQLDRLMYRENEPVRATLYVGNPTHPTISRLSKAKGRKRIINGVNKEPLLKLIEEVM